MDIAASYNTLNGTDAQTRQTVDVVSGSYCHRNLQEFVYNLYW